MAKRKAREEPPPGGKSDYEIAAIMGISRTRVFQMRERATRKIKEAILSAAELRDWAAEILGARFIESEIDRLK